MGNMNVEEGGTHCYHCPISGKSYDVSGTVSQLYIRSSEFTKIQHKHLKPRNSDIQIESLAHLLFSSELQTVKAEYTSFTKNIWKTPLARSRHRWEHDIKEVRCE